MATIATENLKPIRQALDIIVSADETSEAPSSVTGSNFISGYSANERVTTNGTIIKLMDFCNGGFKMDGNAQPITSTALPSGQKYGLIASYLANSNGLYASGQKPTVTINSSEQWDYLTLILCDSKGNFTSETYSNVQWTSGHTTITIDGFTPNERLHVSKVSLGKTWLFDNESLLNLTCVLRGVNTNLEDGTFSLEGSEIEFEAYIGTDGDSYIDVFSRMEKNSPISFTCGYQDDMSAVRSFYMNEATYDSEKHTLKISGYDATPNLLEGQTGGKYLTGNYGQTLYAYCNYLKDILDDAGIEYNEPMSIPSVTDSTQCNIFIDAKSKREILAEAVCLNQDDSRLAITYRDAGNPELIFGNVTTSWDIDEEDTESFKTEIERNVKTYTADLYEYSVSSENEEIATQNDAVSGSIYFIDSTEPIYSVSTSGASLITPYRIKLTAQSSGDISVMGKKIIKSIKSSNLPYTDTDNNQKGISVKLQDMNLFPNDDTRGSLTKDCIHDLLSGRCEKYSFTWRGNPHMKPFDIVNMHRLSTGNVLPSNSLFPSNTLYPLEGTDMTMLVTSVSLEFENGGMKSEVKGRRLT